MLGSERQQLSVGSDGREEEKEMHRKGRPGGFVDVRPACAITHSATLPLLTCIRLHRDIGYLSQQSLATMLVGGYAKHVGDVPLAAVQRSSAHPTTVERASILPYSRMHGWGGEHSTFLTGRRSPRMSRFAKTGRKTPKGQ